MKLEVGLLRRFIVYDPETGFLKWRPRVASDFRGSERRKPETVCKAWNTKMANREALGSIDSSGYKCGLVRRKFTLAHRAAWAIHYGEWPEDQVDHINGNRTDNRIENLRAASNQQNQHNKHTGYGTSQYKGVSWHKRDKVWRADIRINGKRISLGSFKNETDAANAYNDACLKHFGEYARPNGAAAITLNEIADALDA